MKVILKEDVQNLGQQGDVVEVKSGYARNYLMPQKLAVLFTKQQKKSIEEAQRVEERKLEREKAFKGLIEGRRYTLLVVCFPVNNVIKHLAH